MYKYIHCHYFLCAKGEEWKHNLHVYLVNSIRVHYIVTKNEDLLYTNRKFFPKYAVKSQEQGTEPYTYSIYKKEGEKSLHTDVSAYVKYLWEDRKEIGNIDCFQGDMW